MFRPQAGTRISSRNTRFYKRIFPVAVVRVRGRFPSDRPSGRMRAAHPVPAPFFIMPVFMSVIGWFAHAPHGVRPCR